MGGPGVGCGRTGIGGGNGVGSGSGNGPGGSGGTVMSHLFPARARPGRYPGKTPVPIRAGQCTEMCTWSKWFWVMEPRSPMSRQHLQTLGFQMC
ncbi:hypothetical protein EDD29_0655 [Actinocorallia herbida]|uniref:Uncharacterized protein n=1 Tax=Actinocorallia herbida TaxID=58109 RepID=A0A3N1CPC2_9ACTN|nr:hypothetical protein EDD29_0655 [Actinocorallia herbida]